MKIIDFSDPANIQLVGYYPSYGYSLDIAVYNETVYVADITSLMVLDVSEALNNVSGITASLPDRFALHEPYPNPFNSATRIDFSLPEQGVVSLKIFDVLGREVTTLLNGNLQAGQHNHIWNGHDSHGAPIASGVYILRLDSDKRSLTRRVTLVK